MKHEELSLITKEELTGISMLNSHVLYSDEIEDMTKDDQEKIYRYCRARATNPACLKNLEQIRYAITRIYFES